MSRLTQENIVAVLLLVVFCGVVWLCQDFGPRARLIPLPLAVFGIVLVIIQLLWQNLRSTDELQMDMIAVSQPVARGDAQEPAVPDPSPAKPVTWRRELAALGIVGLLLLLVYAVGVIAAVFVFTGAYFLLSRYYGVFAALMYTTIFTGVIYLLFIVALQVQPYHGLITPLVERFM